VSALAVRNLEKSFGGLRVTSDVNLAVEPGERRLIIGPNGAGKTTLFNLITGELRPDSGSITLSPSCISARWSSRARAAKSSRTRGRGRSIWASDARPVRRPARRRVRAATPGESSGGRARP
jgi:ABC-type branched-subunit amino acid transport system ATPase component